MSRPWYASGDAPAGGGLFGAMRQASRLAEMISDPQVRAEFESKVDALMAMYASPDRLEPEDLRIGTTASGFTSGDRETPGMDPLDALLMAVLLERLAAAEAALRDARCYRPAEEQPQDDGPETDANTDPYAIGSRNPMRFDGGRS